MNNFLHLFMKETSDTIEGLTGERPKISWIEEDMYIDELGSKTNISFNNSKLIGNGYIFMPSLLATALGDMMLGGDGEGKETMTDEDLDSVQEIFSNICGSMNTEIEKDGDLPKFSIKKIESSFSVPLKKKNETAFNFIFEINSMISNISLVLDEKVIDFLKRCNFKKLLERNLEKVLKNTEYLESESLQDEKHRIESNINTRFKLELKDKKMDSLMYDIEVAVKVLIGTQTITLEEFKNLKENSVIELNQLANSPLILVVNNVPYAEGEVVVIDGMYGIQLTKLYTKEDVYHV